MMNLKRIFFWGLTAVLSLSLTGCFGLKPAGERGSGKKLYEDFYIGDEGTQYFIKPLSFESEGNGDVMLDITFKYKDEVKDTATINLSLIVSEVTRDLQSVALSNPVTSFSAQEVNYMFSERKKDDYVNRYSIKIPLAEVVRLFEDPNWNVITVQSEGIHTFKATASTRKKIDKLDYQIFDLF